LFVQNLNGLGSGSGPTRFEKSDPDQEKIVRIRNTGCKRGNQNLEIYCLPKSLPESWRFYIYCILAAGLLTTEIPPPLSSPASSVSRLRHFCRWPMEEHRLHIWVGSVSFVCCHCHDMLYRTSSQYTNVSVDQQQFWRAMGANLTSIVGGKSFARRRRKNTFTLI
jgi:hypothetical protein